MKKAFLISVFLSFALAVCAHAEDVKFQASLDRAKIGIGESAQLGLTFYGTQSMPAPDIGAIDGLDIRYMGPSTMMTVINGQISSSITHMYRVQALRIGSFQLGPFSFQQRNTRYISNAVYLDVVEETAPIPARAADDPSLAMEKLNLGERIYVTLEADKLAGYVNELIPVTVRLYVNRMNVSDIQLPVFEQEEFSKAAFKEPKQYRQSIGGVLYDILEFKTNIFGTKPGDYTLGPAKIKCSVMVRKRIPRSPIGQDDFFSDDFGRDPFFEDFVTRYERHPVELKSQELKLIIQPLPSEGRPKDFSGAIGDYQFILNVTPVKLKAGDPLTVDMSINGRGNFNTVIIPKMETVEGFRVYEPQIKTGENTKEFKQILIPENDGLTQIPPLTFTYFNPYTKEYKSITRGPVAISVERAEHAAPAQVFGPAPAPAEEAPKEEDTARDVIYIKEAPGVWMPRAGTGPDAVAAVSGFVSPLILLGLLAATQARRNRIRSDSAYAGRIAAFRVQKRAFKALRRHIKSGDMVKFYELLFKTMQDYLGNRLNIPTAGITYDIIENALTEKNADLDISAKLRRLFNLCDMAKFAETHAAEMEAEDNLKELKEIIDYFERKKI